MDSFGAVKVAFKTNKIPSDRKPKGKHMFHVTLNLLPK